VVDVSGGGVEAVDLEARLSLLRSFQFNASHRAIVDDARAELELLRSRLAAVRALHTSWDPKVSPAHRCVVCQTLWPCPTVRALGETE